MPVTRNVTTSLQSDLRGVTSPGAPTIPSSHASHEPWIHAAVSTALAAIMPAMAAPAVSLSSTHISMVMAR
jgi:hypothetical protein